jgi:hypothetical protein
VFAPPGTIVKLFPEQMEPLLTVTSGLMWTVTLEMAGDAAWQPRELVPVTEYEVVEEGLTLKELPVML